MLALKTYRSAILYVNPVLQKTQQNNNLTNKMKPIVCIEKIIGFYLKCKTIYVGFTLF